jgi:hypothetical protein
VAKYLTLLRLLQKQKGERKEKGEELSKDRSHFPIELSYFRVNFSDILLLHVNFMGFSCLSDKSAWKKAATFLH